MNPKYLDVIACPVCKGPLSYKAAEQLLVCEYERSAYPIQDGILMLERGYAVEYPTLETTHTAVVNAQAAKPSA